MHSFIIIDFVVIIYLILFGCAGLTCGISWLYRTFKVIDYNLEKEFNDEEVH